MNTTLQQKIEEAAKNYADSLALPEWDKRSIHAIDFKKGAVAALQNLWISVEEALPEYDEKVLVCFKPAFGEEKIFLTTRTENTIVYEKNKFCIQQSGEVTHWMSIPSLEGGKK